MSESSEKPDLIIDPEIARQVADAGKEHRDFLLSADRFGVPLQVKDAIRIHQEAERLEAEMLAQLRARQLGRLAMSAATREMPAGAETREAVTYAPEVIDAIRRGAISITFPSGEGIEIVRNNRAQTVANRYAPNPLHVLGNSPEVRQLPYNPLEDDPNRAQARLNEENNRHTEAVVVGYASQNTTFGKLTGTTGRSSEERAVVVDYAGLGPKGPVEMRMVFPKTDAEVVERAMRAQPAMPGDFVNGYVERHADDEQFSAWEAARPQPSPDATLLFDITGVSAMETPDVLQPYLPPPPQPDQS